MNNAKQLAAQWCDAEFSATGEEAFKDIAVMLRTQAARIVELEAQLAAVQNDAERYRWFVAYMISDREDLDDFFVACDTKEEFDYAIDKAITGEAV